LGENLPHALVQVSENVRVHGLRSVV
jgi:hypothetical protein